jgi:hypothetical protein
MNINSQSAVHSPQSAVGNEYNYVSASDFSGAFLFGASATFYPDRHRAPKLAKYNRPVNRRLTPRLKGADREVGKAGNLIPFFCLLFCLPCFYFKELFINALELFWVLKLLRINAPHFIQLFNATEALCAVRRHG